MNSAAMIAKIKMSAAKLNREAAVGEAVRAAKIIMSDAKVAMSDDKIAKTEGTEGYVIWNVKHDMYLHIESRHVRWDVKDFSVINENDIGILQELFWKGGSMEVSFLTGKQATLHRSIFRDLDQIQVIPCVHHAGKRAKLDFINTFKFDGTSNE